IPGLGFGVNGDDAFVATLLCAVIIERRSFADAVFAGNKKRCVWIDNRNRDRPSFLVRTNSPDANRVSTLVSQLFLMKTETHSFFRDQDELVVSARQFGVNQPVAFFDLDGDDAAFPNVSIIG